MSRPKVEIVRRYRGKGFERYEGAVNGKVVSFDVNREDMEKMSDRDQEAFIKKSLVRIKDLDSGKDGGATERDN